VLLLAKLEQVKAREALLKIDKGQLSKEGALVNLRV